VFNVTFSNISAISWRPVLVVEEAGVPGENHRPILLKVTLNTKIKSNVKIINFKNFFKYQIAIIVQLRTDVFFDGFCFGHTTFHIVS
jgi:hypothetical protein